jgi:hypothetical protein
LKGNERKESVKDRVSRRLEVFEKKKETGDSFFFYMLASLSLAEMDKENLFRHERVKFLKLGAGNL